MKVEAALFTEYLPGAQVYYALRALDKSGTGWLCCSVKQVQQITALSYQSVQRIVDQLLERGWLYSVAKKDGKLSIAYKSSRKIVRANPLYISIDKRILKDKGAIKARVAHAYALSEQQKAETKLTYLINRGKLKDLQILSSDSWKYVLSRSNNKPKSKKTTSSSKVLGGYETVVFAKDNEYTVGVNQTTLGSILGVSRQTVGKRMKQVKKVRVYKVTSLASEADGLYIYCDELKETCEAYKPMPNIYEPKPILHKQFKKLKKKAHLLKLSRGQMYVAQLCAITRGYAYSEAGAIQYVLDTGVERFQRNTAKAKHIHTLPWEQEQDRYASPCYLIDPEEED